jgi:hypothetical protein
MKITVMMLVAAAAIGAAVSPGFAQDKLKAAGAVPEGAMPVGAAGESPVAGGQVATGSAKLGNDGAASKVGAAGLVAQPGGVTKVKAVKD